VNITPTLPGPVPPSREPEQNVNPVRPANRARDVVEGDERRQFPGQPQTPAAREELAAKAGAIARPYDPTVSSRINKALASYSRVADQSERSNLQNLLGFDDYA
jgi:hypothetical protein